MSNIKALDRLREFVEEDALLAEMIEAVEREISDRFVELPVDAKGVPWHIGDVTENGNTVNAICFDSYGCHFFNTINDIDPSIHVHYKPRTIEDVLREFAEEVYASHADFISIDGENAYLLAAINETADEIRELMGVSE